MSRPDLLSLSEEALAALTNRGLVKRASREVEAGSGPTIGLSPEGVLTGEHPDGARSTLPPGAGLGSCTCGAAGVCRHLLATVIAYQRQAAPAAAERWSPGEFTDEELEALLGARVMGAARRALRAGYPAKVHRGPEPSVELSTCTVRFLVPRELSFARTDAAPGASQPAVALAVWAFRAADAHHPDDAEVDLDVGEPTATVEVSIDAAVALAAEVLADGVVHIGPSFDATVARVTRDLDRRGLRWPLLAVEALGQQLVAYRARAAHHRSDQVAELLAEIVGRHRAAASVGAVSQPASVARILGTEEPAETPLRRIRLTGLGAFVTGTDDDRSVDILLADPAAGMVLVLRRRWEETTLTGAQLAARRVGGATVAALAAGNVVTESAHRGASRVLRLATGRIAKTTVTPSDGAWPELPDSLLVRDLATLSASLAGQPPRLLRPRIEAESVRAVAVGSVEAIGYQPGDQRLDAIVTDPSGTEALVSLRHDPACPGALDALAGALAAGPSFVAGAVRRTRGGIVVTPSAVVAGGRVIVPALAPGDGAGSLSVATPLPSDPLVGALDGGLGLLAEVAHRGLRHLPPSFPERLTEAAVQLARVGLSRGAEALRDLAAAVSSRPPEEVVTVWADAQLRLLVTRDLL